MRYTLAGNGLRFEFWAWSCKNVRSVNVFTNCIDYEGAPIRRFEQNVSIAIVFRRDIFNDVEIL